MTHLAPLRQGTSTALVGVVSPSHQKHPRRYRSLGTGARPAPRAGHADTATGARDSAAWSGLEPGELRAAALSQGCGEGPASPRPRPSAARRAQGSRSPAPLTPAYLARVLLPAPGSPRSSTRLPPARGGPRLSPPSACSSRSSPPAGPGPAGRGVGAGPGWGARGSRSAARPRLPRPRVPRPRLPRPPRAGPGGKARPSMSRARAETLPRESESCRQHRQGQGWAAAQPKRSATALAADPELWPEIPSPVI